MEITLNILLTIITGIYAYLTYRMVRSSDKSTEILAQQFESLNRPYVTIEPYAHPHTTWLYIKIKNSGKTPAKKLKLTLDRDLFQFGESNKNLRDSTALKEQLIVFFQIKSLFLL